MADYHPLITRAVDGLSSNTAEARRTLYERARAALVAQLRGIEPPLSEAEITRERLALEDAIRKVEAESVRKARSEPRPAAPRSIQATPVAGSPPDSRESVSSAGGNLATARSEPRFAAALRKEAPPPQKLNESPAGDAHSDAKGSARSRLLNARTWQRPREEFKGFRGASNDIAYGREEAPGRNLPDRHGAPPAQQSFEAPAESWGEGGAEHFDNEQHSDFLEDAAVHEPDQIYDFDDQQRIGPAAPRSQRSMRPIDQYREPRPPRSYRGLAKLAAALLIVIGLGALISWQWSHINSAYQFLSHMRSRQTQTAQPPQGEPKFAGRVPQDQGRQSPGTAAPKSQSGAALAQRVVLYEEDSANPQGKQYVGSAVWRTETVSPGSGLAPELQIRADVTVPERNMTVTWTLRRNTDQALPASHTIEIMFNLPADFAGGGISNVPGVLMKESEQARGVPLAGLAVKVTNGFFLIGLSAVDADVQRNLQLLKDRPWFDIPIVYNNGGRAILALEKGAPGERAFADAFAAWGK
jgi:hypothetical protein